jgi:hypothetical protein
MKINLLTVCTDTYPIEYAVKTARRFNQLTDLEFSSFCVTDRPQELYDKQGNTPIVPITPPRNVKGWWNKIYCYSNDMPEGWNVYLDLDIVMVKNFDEEIRHAISKNKKIACVSDAIMWKGNKFSSSMQVFETGSMQDVWEKFQSDRTVHQQFDGGDQVWTGKFLTDTGQAKKVLYLDEKFPKLKMNLKFHLGEKVFGQWQFPQKISPKIKMVDCGGRPKPHDLQELEYIKKNWHSI